ncbi:MAG: Bro-N domain-containing protein [Nanoarchaeota archaeon]|nr:Bro-N domain-containing protein [Nanoarchaeota archaeon]MBU1030243.1 Bro-N domain-containing protein [Nanoarchaeota archaeon]MBU1850672.1 Bro-N domain-containing protein [Nanoarchaeota archaeon]
MKTAIKLFEDKKIRTEWDSKSEKWYFSIIDIVAILTESPNPRKYWSVLKTRLKQEGSQLATNCSQLKMLASDGKYYKTDVADTEQLLRLIQSVPSKKAEPFKLWLARVGKERIDETEDPELSIDRAMKTYLQKGYSKDWINQRLKTIEVRKELTDEWNRVGIIKQEDYSILTNEITKAWAGKTVKEYKQFKNLKKENLRDNMTNLELVLNMLAEATTKEFSEKEDPKTFTHSKKIAKKGGKVAGNTRKDIEKQLGETIVSKKNAKEMQYKDKKRIETL